MAGPVGRGLPYKSATGQKAHAIRLAGAQLCEIRSRAAKRWVGLVGDPTLGLADSEPRWVGLPQAGALFWREVFGGTHPILSPHLMNSIASRMVDACCYLQVVSCSLYQIMM